jgi:4-amino-4-deoxy-L-arabinose transferase-like glycosyltransferase
MAAVKMKKKLLTVHRSLFTNISKWIKENRWEAFFLVLTLLVAAFFRLYRISEYMTFLGDEGRDAIIVRRLIVDFDLILIGPGTSIGNMYLGPLYYYLIAPSLLIANFSPVGPSIFVALLGVVTCAFVWFVAREWFGKLAAGIALVFYSISPVVINYSRSSWNPNIMPFFALLCVYSVWKLWFAYSKDHGNLSKRHNHYWLLTLGISFAFVLQSHYLGLLLGPVLAFFWVLTFFRLRNLKNIKKRKLLIGNFGKFSLYGLGLFLLLMSPLLIFDIRHGWINSSSIKTFFLERQATVSARPWNAFPKVLPISQKIVTRMVAAANETYGKWVVVVLWSGILWAISRFISLGLKEKRNSALFLLLVWIGLSLMGLGLYKQEIYDHYYGFFFPAIFIFLGGFVETFLENRRLSVIHVIIGVILFVLAVVNLQNNPLKYPPNRQMQRAEEVAGFIADEARGEKFNLAVIAERNYEDGYQYFLEKKGESVYDIDPLDLDTTLADILFVVCELPKDECDPTHNPKTEVANFGWSKVDGEWGLAGVTVYKLSHAK